MKILIVGAGLIGLSIAWKAACRGLDVVVVDDAPERSASRVGVGLLIPAGGRVSHDQLQIRIRSAELYPSFVKALTAETGLDCGYDPCGSLTLAYEPKAQTSLDGLIGCLLGLGVACERLTAEQCHEHQSGLGTRVGGGFLTADHLVNPELLLAALREACLGRLVEFRKARVSCVERQSLSLADGSQLKADKVVVAAGAWMARLVDLPLYPVKGEVLHLKGPKLLNRSLRVQKESLYVVPREGGRVVVGATEEDVGFDTVPGPAETLWERANELLPALRDFELLEHRVGFRPKVADGLPLLGEFKGVVVAGGHHRNGILLTPITAELIADFLSSGVVPELMQPFDPEREIRDRRVKA